jgi:NTE family protein
MVTVANPKIAIILSGGGAKGSFQAGALDRLIKEKNLKNVVAVAGVSVGALNALMTATGQIEPMVHLWKKLNSDMVYKERGVVRAAGSFLLHKIGIGKAPFGYYDNSPLRKLIAENTKGKRFQTAFYCGVVNAHNLQYTEFSRSYMHLVGDTVIDYVLASTSIPVVFDTVKINNEHYMDGGVRFVSPIGKVLSHEQDEVYIISTRPMQKAIVTRPVKDVVDVAKNSLSAMMDEIFDKDIREFSRINHMVRQAEQAGTTLNRLNGNPYKAYRAYVIEPNASLGDSLEFTSHRAVLNYKMGYEARRKTL